MDKPALPSNRSFGWTFTGIFIAVGTYGLLRGGVALSWIFALAVLTALVTVTRETWLTPLNRGWMKVGDLLGRVVSPVTLGLIYFGVFTPIGLLMKLCRRDALCRRFDGAARSYWVKRDPPGPADDSFRNMF